MKGQAPRTLLGPQKPQTRHTWGSRGTLEGSRPSPGPARPACSGPAPRPPHLLLSRRPFKPIFLHQCRCSPWTCWRRGRPHGLGAGGLIAPGPAMPRLGFLARSPRGLCGFHLSGTQPGPSHAVKRWNRRNLCLPVSLHVFNYFLLVVDSIYAVLPSLGIWFSFQKSLLFLKVYSSFPSALYEQTIDFLNIHCIIGIDFNLNWSIGIIYVIKTHSFFMREVRILKTRTLKNTNGSVNTHITAIKNTNPSKPWYKRFVSKKYNWLSH